MARFWALEVISDWLQCHLAARLALRRQWLAAILSSFKTLLESGEGRHRLGELCRRGGQLTDVWVPAWAS
jgi:hypothetical protein